MAKKKRPYVQPRSHHTKKASQTYEIWSGAQTRPALANPSLARQVAKRELTRVLKSKGRIKTRPETGANLKTGILAMASVANATDEQMRKLQAMDERKLARLYAANRRTFDVFFSYSGIEYNPYGNLVSDDKLMDIDLLIEQYDRI